METDLTHFIGNVFISAPLTVRIIKSQCLSLICLSLVCLLIFPSVAYPQDDAAVFELAPVLVEARQNSDFASALETGTSLIDLNPSSTAANGTLGEALAAQPGLASSFYGPGASRPIIRGLDGFRVGVFLSGLATGDLSAESPDHAVTIEPLFVRMVEVNRGAAALIFGGSTIGGAVNAHPGFLPVNTLPEGQSGEAILQLSSGSNARAAFISQAHRQRNWALQLNAISRKSDDYQIPNLARTPDYDLNNRLRLPPGVQGQVLPNPQHFVPNSWTDTQSIALGTAWLDPQQTLRAGYHFHRSRYGVPLDGHTHGNPFGTQGITGPSVGDGITIDLAQHRLQADASLHTNLAWLPRIDLNGATSRFNQQEWEGNFLSNAFSHHTHELVAELPWQADDHFFIQRWSLHNATYTNRNITYAAGRADEDFLETNTTLAAFAALAARKWEPFELRVATRADWQHAKRADRRAFARSDLALSAIVEGSWAPTASLKFSSSLSHFERLPNAQELFIEAPRGAIGVFQIPNPALTPETAQSLELAANFQSPRLGASINLFWREFNGFIFLDNQGFEVDGLTAYARTQRDARFSGGEVALHWNPLRQGPSAVRLAAFADWVKASQQANGEPLPRIPPLRVGASARFDANSWNASLQLIHAFKQARVPREVFGTLAYQSPSNAFSLLELSLQCQLAFFSLPAQLTLRFSNILDQEARQHTSFLKDVAPLPGRQAHFTLNVFF